MEDDTSQDQQEDDTFSVQSLRDNGPDNGEVMEEGAPLLSRAVQEDAQVPPQAPDKGKTIVAQALPTGWVMVPHESGGMAYLHKESRIVTLSRPYQLPSSVTVKVLTKTLHTFLSSLSQGEVRLIFPTAATQNPSLSCSLHGELA